MLSTTVQGILEASLVVLADQRLRHPACSMSATALKFISLFLKAHNPSNPAHMATKYKAKLDTFVAECGLAPFIASHAVGGSGISAARRAKAMAHQAPELSEKTARFQQLCSESEGAMMERFLR